MNNITIATIVEVLGTLAFAISGIRLASAKQFDWFGAYVVGLITAIGGGTLRDILLDVPPFWMLNPSYLIVTAIALVIVILSGKRLVKLSNTVFIFDAIGLALFVVIGIQKTLDLGYPFWVAIAMGTITGSVGGIIRDILINEEPLIFRKDIYALACVFGGIVYWVCALLSVPSNITTVIAAVSVVLVRILAVRFSWHLPTVK